MKLDGYNHKSSLKGNFIFNKVSLIKMSNFSEKNTNEVSVDLKNKIRRERILEIIYNQKNKLVTNRTTFYNSAIPKIDAYYKSPTQFSLKGVTEADIIDLKNKKLKKDCIDFLNTIPDFKVDDKLINDFKEMDIDDVLLNTYLYFIGYQITRITPSYNEDKLNSIDYVEEMLDELIAKKEKANKDDELERIMERCKVPNDTKKSWWNLF